MTAVFAKVVVSGCTNSVVCRVSLSHLHAFLLQTQTTLHFRKAPNVPSNVHQPTTSNSVVFKRVVTADHQAISTKDHRSHGSSIGITYSKTPANHTSQHTAVPTRLRDLGPPVDIFAERHS